MSGDVQASAFTSWVWQTGFGEKTEGHYKQRYSVLWSVNSRRQLSALSSPAATRCLLDVLVFVVIDH